MIPAKVISIMEWMTRENLRGHCIKAMVTGEEGLALMPFANFRSLNNFRADWNMNAEIEFRRNIIAGDGEYVNVLFVPRFELYKAIKRFERDGYVGELRGNE